MGEDKRTEFTTKHLTLTQQYKTENKIL